MKKKHYFLAHYLDLIKPHIPTGLVSEAAYEKIRLLAMNVPGALAFSTFGFECRLGNPAADADFLFSLHSDNSGPDILAGNLPESDFPSDFFNDPVWTKVREFGKLWADPPSPIHDYLDDVWLEFDAHAFPEELLPSLFFGPLDKYGSDGGSLGPLLTYEDLLTLMESVYGKIQGQSPAPAMIRKWQGCIEKLPRLKALFQLYQSRHHAGPTVRKGHPHVCVRAFWKGDDTISARGGVARGCE